MAARKVKPAHERYNKNTKSIPETQNISPEQPGTYSFAAIQKIVLFLFAFLLYANTISFEYTIDDAIVITDNQFTQKGFAGIKDILTKDTFFGFFGENRQLVSGGRYRPLSLVTFAVEHQFFGNSPGVSHFINILLYGLTGIMLLLLLYRFFPKEQEKKHLFNLPFIISLLFLAHPLHTEAVANIKGRDEIMCFLGAISALYFLFRYIYSQNKIQLGLSILCFFLSLMSKENAITFLAIIPMSVYFFTTKKLKEIIVYSIPFVLVAGVFWFLRGQFTQSSVVMEVKEVLNNPFVYMSTSERYATVVFTLGKYLMLLLFPHPLTHDYYFNQIPAMKWSDIRVIFSLLVYAALIVYSIQGIIKKTIPAYAAVFYLATFSVVSNIFFPIGTTMSERFLYISSFAFCMVLGMFLSKLKVSDVTEKGQLINIRNKTFLIVLGVILTGYSFKTVTRNEAWKDNYTLFITDIKTSPNSAKLRNSVGGESMAQAEKEQDSVKKRMLLVTAIENLNEALKIHPTYAGAWLLLGNAYFKYDQSYSKALTCYKNSMITNPNSPDVYYNIAVTYKQLEQGDSAIYYFRRLLNFRPKDVNSLYFIGDTYKKQGMADSALVFFGKVAELDPKYPGIYREMGTVYGQLKGDLDNAIVYLRKAIDTTPEDQSAWENLGIAYGFKKDYTQAVAVLSKAIEKFPNNPNLYKNLGVSYGQMGQTEKARECFAKANQLTGH